MIKIAPSMLSSDFAKLGEEVKNVSDAGADYIHLDIMDGVFVPNITFGAGVVKAIRPYSDKVFDVHLMIDNPLKYVEDFAKAGADVITFHLESNCCAHETIEKIHGCGCKAALSLKPCTPASAVFEFLPKIDMVLVMTVEPGFGGQCFMEDMMEKISLVKNEIVSNNYNVSIQVDGGITEKTISAARSAGADIFVAGSSVFNENGLKNNIELLRKSAE